MGQILSIEELRNHIDRAFEIASVRMTGDDPDAYVERANEIASWLPFTGKMVADARYHRDEAIKKSIISALKTELSLPASTLNELVKAECKEINYITERCVQIDKDMKYQLDALRTIISNFKEKYKFLGQNT